MQIIQLIILMVISMARLNDVVLNYDAATSTVTATYAGKTWKLLQMIWN